jgi:acyl-CoA thioester hydrolase
MGRMSSAEVRLRVRYAETDQMGVVYHANYLIWMEMGRVELCRSLGVRYGDMEEQDGVLLAVASASCRYHSPARYDDEIVVRTSIARSSSRLVEFQYEILGADDGRPLAGGSTVHVFCDRDLRPTKLPRKYWPTFQVKERVASGA